MSHNGPNKDRFLWESDPFFVAMRLLIERYGECMTERTVEVSGLVQSAVAMGDDPVEAMRRYEARPMHARLILA